MFNKGKMICLREMTQIAMLVIFLAGIASCASSQPDEGFLNLSVGFAFSNGIVEREKEVTLKEFIGALNKEGKWERGDVNQWIYTIKKVDRMTNTSDEMSILFIREDVEGHAAAIMRRVVSSGEEMPELIRVNVFAEIVKRVLEAKK